MAICRVFLVRSVKRQVLALVERNEEPTPMRRLISSLFIALLVVLMIAGSTLADQYHSYALQGPSAIAPGLTFSTAYVPSRDAFAVRYPKGSTFRFTVTGATIVKGCSKTLSTSTVCIVKVPAFVGCQKAQPVMTMHGVVVPQFTRHVEVRLIVANEYYNGSYALNWGYNGPICRTGPQPI
jgi:hypothetical protein